MPKPRLKAVAPIEVSIPNDWQPLFEWVPWHYGKQKEFSRSVAENWVTVFKAGNGAGKTHILYWNLIAMALGVHPYQSESVCRAAGIEKKIPSPPLNIKVLVNDFEHGLEKVCYETLCLPTLMPNGKHIERILPLSAVKSTPSVKDRSYRLINDSCLFFMTSEQDRKLHSGTNFDILACDEEPKHTSYDESLRGLRNAKGWGRVLMSFTPPLPDDPGAGPTWTRHEMYEPWLEGKLKKPDLHFIEACMRDNPAITEEFIRRFLLGKTDEKIRVQLYGDYPQWGKLVHPDFQNEMWNPTHLRGHLLPMTWQPPWRDEEGSFEFAIDWHASKAPAAIWTYEDRNGMVVVFEEFTPDAVKAKTISELAEIIKEIEGKPHNLAKISRIGDPKMKDVNNAIISGFNAWEAFRDCGIFLHEGYNKQPAVGIDTVNDYFKGDGDVHPRVLTRENCTYLIRALRNHYWKSKPDGTADPDPKWSDYPICLRYILQRKMRKKNKKGKRGKARWGLTSYGNPKEYSAFGAKTDQNTHK